MQKYAVIRICAYSQNMRLNAIFNHLIFNRGLEWKHSNWIKMQI